MDDIRRVVRFEDEDRSAKTETVRALRDGMVRGHVKMVEGWTEDVRMKR